MIKILNSSLTRLGAIKNVLSANRLEILNGENTLDFSATLDGRVAEFVDEDSVYEIDDEYFDTAILTKAANDDGTVTVAVETEHISYRLNDPMYNVQWFTEIGTPSYILGKILEGTGFTIGTVDFGTSEGETDYQKWENYPDSPVLTVEYPYQFILTFNGGIVLILGHTPFYLAGNTIGANSLLYDICVYDTSEWTIVAENQTGPIPHNEGAIVLQTNRDIYTDDTLSEIYFAKTTSGTSETSITYSAQEAKSRRQLLMELVAYLEGEISFNKFEVSIFAHRGSTEITSVIKDRNIKVVSKTVNKRQKDKDGNDLVSYICTPIFIPGDSYTLGDDVALLQKALGLSERLRIVSISRNPYDEMQTTLEFANYTNGLENALFRIETNTIAKGKLYYGARISPEMGFESIRSDMKARTVMNADTFAMQVGDGTGEWYNRLWFDPELNLYIFDGTLSANTINAIKAEIDVVVSQVVITQTLSVEKVVAADITVDELNTSDKIPNYKVENKDPDGYIHIFDARQNFIDAQYVGDVAEEEQKEPVRDTRTGQLVYWTDSTRTAITFEESDTTEPVWQYQYVEFIKMALYLEWNAEDGVFEPVIQMGAGNGVGNNGKFFMRKGVNGFELTYYATGAGNIPAYGEVSLILGDDGVIAKPSDAAVSVRNIAHLAITDTLPDTLQDGDIVYLGFTASDKLEVSDATLLYVQVAGAPQPTFIRCTGTTYSLALPTDAGVEDGVELTFKNVASGTVTLIGTVDGATNYALTAGSFCRLRHNGTDWDRIG